MSDLKSFSVEMVKIAADDASENYASRMVATLPFALKKGLLELPAGAVDKAVDLTIRTGKKPRLASLAGRAIGGSAGAIGAGTFTAPVFLKGINDLKKAKTRSEQQKAYAKIVGSGFAYAAIKGAIETIGDKGLKKTNLKDVARIARNVGSVRGLIGAGSSALTALNIVKNRKAKENYAGRKNTFARDLAGGAALGALKGTLDELADVGLKGVKTPKGIRGVAARVGGRVASGMAGAAILGKLFDSYMKKTSSESQAEPIPTPSSLYREMRMKSAGMPTQDVYAAYSAHIANGDPESNPSRRAVYYALSDTLRERGKPVKQEKMRDKVAPLSKPDRMGASLLAVIAAPHAMMAVTDRISMKDDDVIRSSLDAQIAKKGISVVAQDPDSLWHQHSGFFDIVKREITVGAKAKPEILAHELGHADASILRRQLQKPGIMVSAHNAGAAALTFVPILAVANASDPSFTTKEELQSRKEILDTVRGVGTLAMAPRLADEALASIKGVGYIAKGLQKSTKNSTEAMTKATLRMALRMGPGMATYLSPLLVSALASRYLSKKIKERENGK